MFNYFCLGLLFFLSFSASAQHLQFNVPSSLSRQPVIRFAMQELQEMLPAQTAGGSLLPLVISFSKDTTLPDGTFGFRIQKQERLQSIELYGTGETEILHAGYSFLEHIGYRFDISGQVRPTSWQTDTLRSGDHRTLPYTRWRGIRQHVNFPMDISSYPIGEAKEYLNRLVRMRFNKIAVHSYPNLWHEVKTGDSTEYAGNFFYNRPHDIPNVPVLKENILYNKRYFSIPEIEPYYENRLMRSKMATAWMQALLTHAKKIGLTVHFSVEPRTRGDIPYILDNVRSAIESYPMIDELEINTEELGGWGNTCSDSTVKAILTKRFGKDILNDTFVTRRIARSQTDLDNLMEQVGRNIEAIRRIRQADWYLKSPKRLKLGIYCTIVNHADLAYHLIRTYLPDTDVTIMPGHGSERSAAHFAQIHKKPTDLQRTTLFSWIEFDGLMFTQQNPIEGIAATFRHFDTIKGKQPVHAVLYNHWRTAENAVTARFASESALYGPIHKEEFYSNYARTHGFTDAEAFRKAMILLETADRISTNELPNIGFCWLGAWLNGGPFNWMNRQKVIQVRQLYDTIQVLLNKKDTTLQYYPSLIPRLLRNRIKTSITYLRAFETACLLQEIRKQEDGKYALKDQERAKEIIRQSFGILEQYMAEHAALLPDRGSEGTLINLWHGPVYGLKVLRERYTGIPVDAPLSAGQPSEGPPLPILINQ